MNNDMDAASYFIRAQYHPWFSGWTVKYLYDYGQLLKEMGLDSPRQ